MIDFSFSPTKNGILVKKHNTNSMEQSIIATRTRSELENFYIKNSNISEKLVLKNKKWFTKLLCIIAISQNQYKRIFINYQLLLV
ncbi:hypothetical protein [Chryseobacterium sp.]|uniref:hypothetical protein n=1 Tax=Chryseobacterium sp. TaxID=1871047 RepID=UPI003890DBEE